MLAAVATSSPAAVAGQQQYTSGKTNTFEKRVSSSTASQSQSTVGDILEANQAHYNLNVDDELPRTPGLYWDESDASSDASISPNMKSVFEEWDDVPQSSCSVEVDEDGSQVVTIRSDSPFYLPHAVPRPFDFTPFSDPAFPDSFPSSDQEDASFEKYWASYQKPSERTVPALRESVIVVGFTEAPLEIVDGISFETGWYVKHGEDIVPENWPTDVKSAPDAIRDTPTRAATL